ncbi:CHAP domain-containing protein [Kitasatospora sp. NPDC059571]|uniref:CHAP domain-containing protein n=1 Tax=Kitasatospora sp. NPDC059571 TaxID=3346871 RepID=UPI003688079C
MTPTRLLHRISGLAAAAALALGLLTLGGAEPASAAPPTGTGAAALAAANVAKTAGSCADTPTVNSLGGSQFEHSCSGGPSGGPEYWCADFALWVWRSTGFYTGGLDASAASFLTYGRTNNTLHTAAGYAPQPGDAVVYGSTLDGAIHHVGIVTAVNADGSVTTANGDWGGDPNATTMAGFAVTSRVASLTLPAGQTAVGSVPSTVDPADGYVIEGYTTPAATGPANPYTPTQVCGAGYGVIDSHDLGGAAVYLLYDPASGRNCVVTEAADPAGPVALGAVLTVQGGSTTSDQGSYTYYAGPVSAPAAGACVRWGGTYRNTSWTSDWSHCG